MKISMKMLTDLGVCEGANKRVGEWFKSENLEIADYDYCIQALEAHADHLKMWISKNTEDNDPHSEFSGWLSWFKGLRNNVKAITYFGDHIEENTFMTHDGYLHESLESAINHRNRVYSEIIDDYRPIVSINGVVSGENGLETWTIIDIDHDDISEYDAFMWHDANTGINRKTTSPTIAKAFANTQRKIIDQIKESKARSVILRKITDESGVYSAWIKVTE